MNYLPCKSSIYFSLKENNFGTKHHPIKHHCGLKVLYIMAYLIIIGYIYVHGIKRMLDHSILHSLPVITLISLIRLQEKLDFSTHWVQFDLQLIYWFFLLIDVSKEIFCLKRNVNHKKKDRTSLMLCEFFSHANIIFFTI